MKSTWLIAVLFATCTTHGQSLKVVPAQFDAQCDLPKSIQFFCTRDYDPQACREDVMTLQERLLSYPSARLGEWSFVLATRKESIKLQHRTDGSSETPAFTYLNRRTTIIERDLFFATTERTAELAAAFGGRKGAVLLEFGISHELGHALCNEADERRADDYGWVLRDGKSPNCSETRGHKAVLVAQNPE